MKNNSFCSFTKLYTSVFLVIGIVSLIYLVYIFSMFSNRGIDFTDESFLLLHIAQVKNIYGWVSQFGYMFHPMYSLVGNNLSYFRVSGLFLLLSTTYVFIIYLFKFVYLNIDKNIKYGMYVTIVLLISVINFYQWGMKTPSYNLLNLIAVMLLLVSLFKIAINNNITNSLLLSFSGVLIFLVKPPTIVILFPFILIWIIKYMKKEHIIKFIISNLLFSILFIIIFSYLSYGSINSFLQSYIFGIQQLLTLDAGQGIFGPLADSINGIYSRLIAFYYPYLAYAIFTVVFIFVLVTKNMHYRFKYLVVFSITSGLCFYFYKLLGNVYLIQYYNTWSWMFEIYKILIIVCFIIVALNYNGTKKIFKKILFLNIIMMIATISYHTGTNNHFLGYAGIELIFLAINIMVLSKFIDEFYNMNFINKFVGLIIILETIFTIQYSNEGPYRVMTQLTQQNHKVKLMLDNNILYVDEKTRNYIDRLQENAFIHGWENGKYIIDFTGINPGIHVILGSKFFSAPWLIGGVNGSDNFAYNYLSTAEKNELHKAWILTTPDGNRKLSNVVLEKLEINLNRDYMQVVKLELPYTGETHILWKPKKKIGINQYDRIKYKGESYTTAIKKFKKEDENIPKDSIVFFGDSLTALGKFDKYFPNNLIVNRGIHSDVLYGMYNRTDEILRLKPKIVFMMAGINDIDHCVTNDKEFKLYVYDLYKIIIDAMLDNDINVVIQSTLYTGFPSHKELVTKLNVMLKDLVLKYKSVGKTIEYIDLNEELSINKMLKAKYVQKDKAHLTKDAYEVWYNQIKLIVEGHSSNVMIH